MSQMSNNESGMEDVAKAAEINYKIPKEDFIQILSLINEVKNLRDQLCKKATNASPPLI